MPDCTRKSGQQHDAGPRRCQAKTRLVSKLVRNVPFLIDVIRGNEARSGRAWNCSGFKNTSEAVVCSLVLYPAAILFLSAIRGCSRQLRVPTCK
jgi:hypothetical protein